MVTLFFALLAIMLGLILAVVLVFYLGIIFLMGFGKAISWVFDKFFTNF